MSRKDSNTYSSYYPTGNDRLSKNDEDFVYKAKFTGQLKLNFEFLKVNKLFWILLISTEVSNHSLDTGIGSQNSTNCSDKIIAEYKPSTSSYSSIEYRPARDIEYDYESRAKYQESTKNNSSSSECDNLKASSFGFANVYSDVESLKTDELSDAFASEGNSLSNS
jgi:hypothetical protein